MEEDKQDGKKETCIVVSKRVNRIGEKQTHKCIERYKEDVKKNRGSAGRRHYADHLFLANPLAHADQCDIYDSIFPPSHQWASFMSR